MNVLSMSELARSVTYQLCRTTTGDGDVDLVMNLFVGLKTVSVTTIARLAPGDAAAVVSRCISHLESLGIRPVDDAITSARAA